MDDPGMMKVEVTTKGKGGRKEMIKEALENVRLMVDAEDMNAIESRRAPPPTEATPEGMEMECEECKNGTCTEPEHNEDAMSEMMAGMGGE